MKLDSVVAAAIRFGRGAAGDAIVAWKGDLVYCLSYDRTVCLAVKRVIPSRQDEVVFRACDYEGPDCAFQGKFVVFKVKDALVRVPRPPFTFGGLDSLFTRLRPEGQELPSLLLDRSILSLLDDALPHVEFRWDGKQTRIIQRDIYSGKIVEIQRDPRGVAKKDPLAIRSGDFFALFSLAQTLNFTDCGDYFYVSDLHTVEAVVGGCLYDDLGKLSLAGGGEDIGGQESEGNEDQ